MHRVREKGMGRSEGPLPESLHCLSSPRTNRCPGRVPRRLQQNGAEDDGRRGEAEQSGALGGRCEKGGRVWSAAAVTAGTDLAAEFARTFFDLEVVEFAKVISEGVVNSDRPDPYAWLLEGMVLDAGK